MLSFFVIEKRKKEKEKEYFKGLGFYHKKTKELENKEVKRLHQIQFYKIFSFERFIQKKINK